MIVTRALLLASILAAAGLGCDLRPEDFSGVSAAGEAFGTSWSTRINAARLQQGKLVARAQALPAEMAGMSEVQAQLLTLDTQLNDLETRVAAVRTDADAKIGKRLRRVAEDTLRRGAVDLKSEFEPLLAALGELGPKIDQMEKDRAATPLPPPPDTGEPIVTEDEAAKGKGVSLTGTATVDINDPSFARATGSADVPGIVFKPQSQQFDYDAATTKAALTRLVTLAQSCNELRLSLIVHTAKDGDADVNQKLSLAQADAIRQHLLAQGVNEAKLAKFGGVGGAEPLVAEPEANSPEEKAMAIDRLAAIRARNRRVTVKVIVPCPAKANAT